MFLSLLIAATMAHPNAQRIVAHSVELHIEVDEAQIRYAVELPRHAHTLTAADDAQTLDETLIGLRLAADGEPLTLSADWTEGPVGTDSNSSRTSLILSATHNASELTVDDGNYPDLPGYFAQSVTIGPGLDVVSCSLFAKHEDGSWRGSRAQRWQIGDEHRALSVKVRQRARLLERVFDWFAPLPPKRTAWDAREGAKSWTEPSPPVWLAYLVLALVLGGSQGPSDREATAPLVLGAGLTVLAAALGSLAWAVSLATIVAVLGRKRTQPALPLVAFFPLASLADPALVAVAVALALAAALASPIRRPIPAVALLLAGASLLRAAL